MHRSLVALALVACVPPSHTVDAGEPDAGEPDAELVETDAGPPPIEELCWPITPSMRAEERVELTPVIRSAGVYFLVDVTASMGDEIDQLRMGLADDLIPGLHAAIPEIEIAIGAFGDFPEPQYGDTGDVVLEVFERMTTRQSEATAAANMLMLGNGLDRPESMTEAVYLSITGEGLGTYVAPASCPTGRFGHPCFREGQVPVLVLITDAPTHNGPGGSEPYTGITPTPHTFEEALTALANVEARTIGLYSGEGEGLNDLRAFASRDGDGQPIVFDIGQRGERLTPSVVDAIAVLASETTLRVTMAIQDVDGDAEDSASWFSAAFGSVEPPGSLIGMDGDEAEVIPGAHVAYDIAIAAPSSLPSAAQRVRFSLREQSGSEVGAIEVALPTSTDGCP
jgi:hypothetical protein